MNPAKRITVLLAEDHEIVRSGLRRLLEAENEIVVLAEASTGRQAVELTKRLRPAVVVMDIAMPLLNGVEATRHILRAVPGTKVLILSAHGDDAYVEGAIAAGAVGYLIKQTSVHTLIEAIREVQKGNTYFGPVVARRRHKLHPESLDRKGRSRTKVACLSSREVEVLQLVAEGEANKQIAAELGISTKTVEKHRNHLMQKLDIHETAGLTRYAIAAGVIENSVQLTII
jgi:DNA-binding NarL/FixJ family response regulator